MFKFGAVTLIVLGVAHMLVFGLDAKSYVLRWASGELWTMEHWLPVASQRAGLALSNLAFWSSVASMAVPMMVLAALLLWLDRRRVPIPRAIPMLVFGWSLLLLAAMPPSGFPLVAAAAAAMAFGRPRGGWA
jgi:hypothetical protein